MVHLPHHVRTLHNTLKETAVQTANPLEQLHSFALPARAAEVRYLASESDLVDLTWRQSDLILGAGTNTVFPHDYPGRVLVNRFKGRNLVSDDESWLLQVGAGEDWHQLVIDLVDQDIPGLENLALIPGSVGAAPVQNIGAYGVEVSRYIRSVEGIRLKSGQPFKLAAVDCEFRYRHSIFKRPELADWLITKVEFCLPKAWQPELSYPDLASLPETSTARDVMREVIHIRQVKLPDPSVLPNAGSFFKNPVVNRQKLSQLQQQYPEIPVFKVTNDSYKVAAGWLIDQAGLKGYQIGGAAVHTQQALVLVNRAQACGADVLALARLIQQTVLDKYGLELEPEVGLPGVEL